MAQSDSAPAPDVEGEQTRMPGKGSVLRSDEANGVYAFTVRANPAEGAEIFQAFFNELSSEIGDEKASVLVETFWWETQFAGCRNNELLVSFSDVSTTEGPVITAKWQ